MNARWIWYKGDFEIYHSILLHSRREYKGTAYPCMWGLTNVFPRVSFKRSFVSDCEFTFTAITNAVGNITLDGILHPLNAPVTVAPGEHTVVASLIKSDGLPCLFIDSDYLITDEGFSASYDCNHFISAACRKEYSTPEITPEVFLFQYSKISPVSCNKHENGYILDFGKETFAQLVIENAQKEAELLIYYGESLEEAADTASSIITDAVSGESSYRLPARAFRYVNIKTDGRKLPEISAFTQLYDIKEKNGFECSESIFNEIEKVSLYTLKLNSREFFTDGIKRDRWVWSGDAYQSFLCDYYSFADYDIIRRTIIALLGKPPYTTHINTINDYSMFLIISVWDYYFNTGDKAFIDFIYPRLKELFLHITFGLDENGFVIMAPGDWIFIDWADFDKTDPFCPEQILLWKTYLCMYEISSLENDEIASCIDSAKGLKSNIMRLFYDSNAGAFIDSYTSGKKHVTRHASVLAVLFDFVDEEMQKSLFEKCLNNSEIPQITTPYFRFYELAAKCKITGFSGIKDDISAYWGGMLKEGATTFWEMYDPNEKGMEKYSAYGEKFGKSLCHAWGAGPLFLIGRFLIGVTPLKPGFKEFSVSPDTTSFSSFKGTVPIGENDYVSVDVNGESITAFSTKAGGVLRVLGKEVEIPVNKQLTVFYKQQL